MKEVAVDFNLSVEKTRTENSNLEKATIDLPADFTEAHSIDNLFDADLNSRERSTQFIIGHKNTNSCLSLSC